MEVKSKLTICFVIILTVSIVLAVVALIALQNTASTYQNKLNYSQQRVQVVLGIRYDTMDLRRITTAVRADSGNVDRQQAHASSSNNMLASINTQLDRYIELVRSDPALSAERISKLVQEAESKRTIAAQYKNDLIDPNIASAMIGDTESAAANTAAQTENGLIARFNTATDEMVEYEKVLADELIDSASSEAVFFQTLLIVVALIAVIIILLVIRFIISKVHWYENILDNIPFPISITDKDLNWTFINRAVEDFLGKKRPEVLGQQCSSWGAAICNTANCGVKCLGRGQPSTSFNQMGMDFKVDSAYLKDKKGNNNGHIEIVQDITEMIKKQKAEAELVDEIGRICSSFVNASRQISDGAQALAQGSTEQAASIQELSASITDIAEKTKANADMAGRATSLADTIMKNAEKGSHQMDEMTAAVKEINQASNSISKVIKVIDDIAFQTNILALNAAVEAARAGQHGKGFAVVAEEVRNLAAKSAEAAKDTGGLIANSMEKAELGARIADSTAASLTEIVAGINESSRIVGEIAKSSEEQSTGIAQINTGIDQVAHVVQQNSATAQESAASSTEMSGQSAMLEELIMQFQQKDGAKRKKLQPPQNNPNEQLAMPAKSSYPPSSGEDFGKY